MPSLKMCDVAEYESVADGNYILCYHRSILGFPLLLFDTQNGKQEYFELSVQQQKR